MNILDTIAEREARYGPLASNARIAQGIKNVMRSDIDRWLYLSADKREALDMIASKISRILSGDPEYRDNWWDIAGFSTLIADTLAP